MRGTRLVCLLFASVIPAVLSSQATRVPTRQAPAPQSTAAQEETAIHEWLDRWAKAFRAHDLQGILALYSPGVIAFDIVPPLEYAGRDAYGKDYVEFMAQYKGPIDVEFRDLHIVVDGTLAYAAGLERISGTLTSGQLSDVWGRFTSVFRKTGGRWLDVHDHVSVPADLASGKAVLDLKP